MLLVVRREGDRLKRYAHLGTGNYHPGTARLYTDYGLFTADEGLTEDIHQVFLQLTSMTQTPPLKKLVQAPFGLQEHLLSHIEQETSNANSGGTGHIVAKINALVEPQIIQALYRASCAGVIVDLIVRGLCCLRPGIPGVSDNIRVRSIIGRFLEHSRVFYFHSNGEEKVYCSSADWMDRNMFRRVEACFPIEDDGIKKRVTSDLDIYLHDNIGAWELQPDGTWVKQHPKAGEEAISVQNTLLYRLSEVG
jgi:polyphosphate kinase